MNEPKKNLWGLILAITGTFLIVAAILYVTRQYTRPAPLGANRIQERQKFLAEIQAANTDGLNNYAWLDQAKGWIRLPITNAMDLTIREYRNPAAARSNLAMRADKAFAPPPPVPKAPEKPNPFE